MADTIKKLAIEGFKSIMQSLARIRIEALIRKAGMGAIWPAAVGISVTASSELSSPAST